jgi:hypothetical protein
MVEAVRATTEYAFDALGLVRVFAVPFVTSTRSSRVLEKAGYVREGLMRRSAVKEGQILDQFLHAAYSDRPLPWSVRLAVALADGRFVVGACGAIHCGRPHPSVGVDPILAVAW